MVPLDCRKELTSTIILHQQKDYRLESFFNYLLIGRIRDWKRLLSLFIPDL